MDAEAVLIEIMIRTRPRHAAVFPLNDALNRPP
jgi:hypothetical protein